MTTNIEEVPHEDEVDPWATSDSSSTDEPAEPRSLIPGGDLAGSGACPAVDDNFFHNVQYRNKADVTASVVYYNWYVHRGFTVAESDKRRFSATCQYPDCSFIVRFAFSSSFKPPSRFQPHSCSITRTQSSSRLVNRICHAKHIVGDPDVRRLFLTLGRAVTPRAIHEVLLSKGLQASYKNRLRAKQRVLRELFGSPENQFEYLPWYAGKLSPKGHHVALEITDGVFVRMAIIYREGLQAFRHYTTRGLVLDGTHLKSSSGGTLFVTCFRNGNNQIQIVAIAIASIENEDNWAWFARFLLLHMQTLPAFFISDRDKGLLQALRLVFPNIPHFYCFRHLMENFNKKFKSKQLKALAWRLARCTTKGSFQQISTAISEVNESALRWLLEIGVGKWSLLHSPLPRFGVLTSNHVESVNGVLKEARCLPVLDCLLAIEYYVGQRNFKSSTSCAEWGHLTQSVEKKADKCLAATASLMSFVANSRTTFVVSVRQHKENVKPKTFSVSLAPLSYSCGSSFDMLAPCPHALFVIHKTDLSPSLDNYYDDTWKTSSYRMAYPVIPDSRVLPMTVTEDMYKLSCSPPSFNKKRGRPKVSRYESQAATENLRQTVRRTVRCGVCRATGHNRATCTQSDD